MCVYVCMYVCMYVCIYTYIHTYIYIYIHTYVYSLYIYIPRGVNIDMIYIYIYIDKDMHSQVFVACFAAWAWIVCQRTLLKCVKCCTVRTHTYSLVCNTSVCASMCVHITDYVVYIEYNIGFIIHTIQCIYKYTPRSSVYCILQTILATSFT